MMPRNLDRRVEVLFPVQDEKVKNMIITHILETHLNDDVKARILLPSMEWTKVQKRSDEGMNSQDWFLKNRGIWHGEKQSG